MLCSFPSRRIHRLLWEGRSNEQVWFCPYAFTLCTHTSPSLSSLWHCEFTNMSLKRNLNGFAQFAPTVVQLWAGSLHVFVCCLSMYVSMCVFVCWKVWKEGGWLPFMTTVNESKRPKFWVLFKGLGKSLIIPMFYYKLDHQQVRYTTTPTLFSKLLFSFAIRFLICPCVPLLSLCVCTL